jgi:predicted nucleic acid-binding protein
MKRARAWSIPNRRSWFESKHLAGFWPQCPPSLTTGPLVAFFDRAEQHHRWAVERIDELDGPLLVCEPVLAETHVSARGATPRRKTPCSTSCKNGALKVALRVEEHVGILRRFLQKYQDTPMSLADACIVRMSEIHERHAGLDARFGFFRSIANMAGFRSRSFRPAVR